jgi:hypothetical protein
MSTLPSVARFEAIGMQMAQYFPDLGGMFAAMAEGRATGAKPESMYELAKENVNMAMQWKDPVDEIEKVPMEHRYEASKSLGLAFRCLRDCLTSQSGVLQVTGAISTTDNLTAAMGQCPATNMDEYRTWSTGLNAALKGVAWPRTPSRDEARGALHSGENLRDWLLRSNPRYEATKGPSSSAAAKKVAAKQAEKNSHTREAAAKRLAARAKTTLEAVHDAKGTPTDQPGSGDTGGEAMMSGAAGPGGGGGEAEPTEGAVATGTETGGLDFQSAEPSGVSPAQGSQDASADAASTSIGVMQFGAAE